MTTTKYQLTMRSGPAPGKTFFLEKEETILGRLLDNDISIGDPEISRRHTRFFLRDDNVFVEDLGSTNGTFLNGERVISPQQLRKGDMITVGESVILVYDKLFQTADETVVSPPVDTAPAPGFTPPAPAQHYVIEEDDLEAEPWEDEQPEYEHSYSEASVPEYVPPPKKKAKQGGMPTWMIILLIAIVVFVCVIAVTMYFMPASWWCALTFDSLAGCPLP